MSKEPSEIFELEDRDPNKLNEDLQISWDEIVGEPSSLRSPECAWGVSHKCYQLSRNCCYISLSVICAPLIACLLGISFACLSFEQIWCTIPCLRIWRISCHALRQFVLALVNALIVPITAGCGYCFHKIRVTLKKSVSEGNGDSEDILMI